MLYSNQINFRSIVPIFLFSICCPFDLLYGHPLELPHINDLPLSLKGTNSFGYADDYKVLATSQQIIDHSVQKINLVQWKLRDNAKKFTLVNFNTPLQDKIKQRELSNVNIQNNLGILVNMNFKCNDNIEKKIRSVSALNALRQNVAKFSITTKLNAYKGDAVPLAVHGIQATSLTKKQFENIWKGPKKCNRVDSQFHASL